MYDSNALLEVNNLFTQSLSLSPNGIRRALRSHDVKKINDIRVLLRECDRGIDTK